MPLFSIGHSNATLERFLELLQQHKIDTVVDVRSQPYSRYNPHFSREALKKAVEAAGLRYLYLGDRIGGMPADKRFLLEDGSVDYAVLAESDPYLEGIEQLLQAGETNRVSFMCAEADYHHCHRYRLITRTLFERGIEVRHIMHSGEIQATDPDDFVPRQGTLF